MKIKKDFVNLIYNKEKQYEFRNSGDKAGIYKIKDKMFSLEYIDIGRYIKLYEEHFINETLYYVNYHKVTKQEFDWIKNNLDYFKDDDNDMNIYIYVWKEIKLKELKEVE